MHFHPALLAKENLDILATRCVKVLTLIEAGGRSHQRDNLPVTSLGADFYQVSFCRMKGTLPQPEPITAKLYVVQFLLEAGEVVVNKNFTP